MIAETVYLDARYKPRIKELVYQLPGILAGTVTTSKGEAIRKGFRARIGYSILSSVYQNLQLLSAGDEGEGGIRWQPLNDKYVVYKRLTYLNQIFAGKTSPGGYPKEAHKRRGLVDADLMVMWKKFFRARMEEFEAGVSQYSYLISKEAKKIFARQGWAAIKKFGATSMIETYRNKQVPIMQKTGAGFRSLEPAALVDYGVRAVYRKRPNQVFEIEGDRVSVGTSVGYMVRHHTGMLRSGIQRRLWPETFPATWLSRALERGLEGLVKIHQLFG
jgi:hypothetical protein